MRTSSSANALGDVLILKTVTSRLEVTKIEKDKTQMTKKNETTTTAMTGFAFHKVVNARLAAEGLTMTGKDGVIVTKRIPPQMIYNYTVGRINAGKKPFIALNDQGLIEVEVGNAWLEKYIAKQLAKALATVEA